MKGRIRIVMSHALIVWTIISLLGCSLAIEPAQNPSLSDEQMVPLVARVLDEQLSIVQPILEEHGELSQQTRQLMRDADGESIILQMLEEDHGADYLQFCHAVASGAESSDVLESAQSLISDEEFEELSGRVAEVRRSFVTYAESQMRAIPPNQRPAFMRDLQKLVTKTLVLMIAGIVYACIPKVMFWGKVTAAAAISVAAGVTATTILSIYRYYKYGEDSASISFQEWIVDVTTDPSASYAVATSMITVGKTMSNGPVVTGLILVVFAIYQVMDMVKPMLKKYNFDA